MRRIRLQIALIVASVAALAAALFVPAAAGASTGTSHTRAVKVGTFSFTGLGRAPSGHGTPLAPPHQPMNKTLHHTAASPAPNVSATPVIAGQGGAAGFNGLDDYQQTTAGTGRYANSQFDVTPPDQGLCVGHGDVLEATNLAMRIYSTSGTPLTATVPLNQFVNVAPEVAKNPDGSLTYGPFLSDPKCYYDPGSGRWFMSFLQFSVDPATGAFGNSAQQYVAVTQTSDPTGSWTIYAFSTTDDGTQGTPAHPGCPCFGDQPLIGADANGFYVSTNEYAITGPAYNGAQLYAMSKTALESGSAAPAVIHMEPGTDPGVTNTLGGVAFSIQPATSPAGGYDTAANGTAYFQSALDFGAAPALGTSANRIAVWSLTNTASLVGADPAPALHVVVVPSEAYAQPPNSSQARGTLVINKHLPLLQANDDRMNQVVYAAGHLWSGLNTAVQTPQGPTASGIAWFATTPSTDASGSLSASMAGQGYLGVNKEDVMYPSIGVTPAGKAVMAFTLTGPDFHPTAAWAPLTLNGVGPVYQAAAGRNADDDFSAAPAFGGTGSGRWGDYSAAVSDPSGTIWMGTEYISGVERTPYANWATYIAHVTP